MNMDDRENIERLFNLVHEAFVNKDYKKAIEYLDEIIDIYNKDIIAYSDGKFIIYSDSYDNEEETNINNDDINITHNTLVDAYYNRAISKYNMRNYEESIKDFDTSIKLDSTSSNAYYFRGLSKNNLELYKESYGRL